MQTPAQEMSSGDPAPGPQEAVGPRPARGLALSVVPGATATSSWIAVSLTFHRLLLAWPIAGLAGLLSLFAVLMASGEAQQTIQVWIRHRAEHRVAAAEAFEIRHRIRKATCGSRRKATNAASIRHDAAACERPHLCLPEIMQITRHELRTAESAGLPAADRGFRPRPGGGDGGPQLVAVPPADHQAPS